MYSYLHYHAKFQNFLNACPLSWRWNAQGSCLEGQTDDFYFSGLNSLPEKCRKCIELSRDHIEKQSIVYNIFILLYGRVAKLFERPSYTSYIRLSLPLVSQPCTVYCLLAEARPSITWLHAYRLAPCISDHGRFRPWHILYREPNRPKTYTAAHASRTKRRTSKRRYLKNIKRWTSDV